MNGAGEPLGERTVNLLENAPEMPTLQTMHRVLAKHPMLQARLFLLLDELVHVHLLCMTGFIGERWYGKTGVREPAREDDFASSLQVGLAQLPRSALKPLEAQGRGFAHGHEKIISVPRWRAARLKQLFTTGATEHRDDELAKWCTRAREALLHAAATLQYDSAVLSGKQLGVPLRPEPFSELQQRRSRLDGQVEEMHDNAPRRPLLPVTAPEPNGHLRREMEQAEAEQRLPRHAYKQLPLTGAAQSMMPMYRRPDSFGRIQIPDEYGYYPIQPERQKTAGWRSLDDMYEATPLGEVTGLLLPDGAEAAAQDIQDDSDAWATSFARDQRSCFIQNHNHECTGTCVKPQKKKKMPRRRSLVQIRNSRALTCPNAGSDFQIRAAVD